MDLQFQCVRKHFFKNQQYTIFVNHDKLLIGKNHTQPKYELLLDLKTVICFSFDECSLTIPVGKKSKKFYLSNTDLKYLKQILDNRVSYANMQSYYRIIGDLGSGGYSKVLHIQDLDTKEYYAAKIQPKQRTGKSQSETVDSIYNEILILSHLDHNHILKIKEVYDRGHQIAIIQQLIQGMTLQDFITSRDLPPTQRDIQIIIRQILDAVRYIHQQGFIHRDIKPENIMIDQLHIKLIDFGLATQFTQNQQFVKCGTAGYIAPEVMFGDYDYKCDIFSIGVVFYQLLTQEEPFGQIEQSPQFEEDQMHQINYSHLEENQVDEVAIDLLKKLLESNPKNRLSALEALQHPYFKMNYCTPIKIQPMSKLNSQSTAIITPLQYDTMTPLKKQLVPKTLLDESLIFD